MVAKVENACNELELCRSGVALLTADEVTKLWRCHRITLLRLIRGRQLHPVEVDGDLRFDQSEVLRLNNQRISVYPHFTVCITASVRLRARESSNPLRH